MADLGLFNTVEEEDDYVEEPVPESDSNGGHEPGTLHVNQFREPSADYEDEKPPLSSCSHVFEE